MSLEDEQKRWLASILKRSGHGTRTALARHLGVTPDMITRMSNVKPGKESRSIKLHELIKMAEFFRVEPPGISAARNAIGPPKIRVLGKVGAAQPVMPFDGDDDAPLEEIDPIPADAFALIVEGDSMYPRYMDGERIICTRKDTSPSALIGQECAVRLKDGRLLVKTLRKGSRGKFNLESYNAPLIEDAAVEWAAPVLWRVGK